MFINKKQHLEFLKQNLWQSKDLDLIEKSELEDCINQTYDKQYRDVMNSFSGFILGFIFSWILFILGFK